MSLESESHIFRAEEWEAGGEGLCQKVLGPAAVAGLVAPPGGRHSSVHTISLALGQSSLRVA